ncbi:hypothetical protein FD723_15420 [Nostoc sp. C052]|uniref:hypothetical protein n=1 Tax=Nostoc sp. C052 TaxID=2576902 RepID=UPI0015C3BBD9|nr:hypothetical protein [Nostoc sp. C052]QLE41668.1 hypothetical protein FD723_15420 [Nostoc sp. C052]
MAKGWSEWYDLYNSDRSFGYCNYFSQYSHPGGCCNLSDITSVGSINHHKDAINRRLYNQSVFVLTAIHRVS